MLDTHVIRLGTHPEKDYLLRAYTWFDEVLLNANLVEATAASLGIFLIELRDKDRGYFMDPMTYAFALSPNLLMRQGGVPASRSNLKRTFRRLADQYGSVIGAHAGEKAMQPGDFTSQQEKEEFCVRVLDYQRNRLNEAISASEAFLMEELVPLVPTRLIAPYFYLSGEMEWLELDLEFASIACEMEPTVWVGVCFDSLLLYSDESLDRLIDTYRSLPTPGYLLWASDFIEERATAQQISGLRTLIGALSQGGEKKVVSMFGGYFSCLLAEYGLTGVSHGLGYGERRDIEPVLGGGQPPAKYYLPPIHKDIRIDQFVAIAQGLNEGAFERDVCNCVICTGLLRQGMDALIQQYADTEIRVSNNRYREVAKPQVYRFTRFHYLNNKSREFKKVREVPYTDLLDQLDWGHERFRGELGSSSLAYLHTWRRALAP